MTVKKLHLAINHNSLVEFSSMFLQLAAFQKETFAEKETIEGTEKKVTLCENQITTTKKYHYGVWQHGQYQKSKFIS